MSALADRQNGGLGGADQPHDLALFQTRMVPTSHRMAFGRSWRRDTGV